MKRHYWPIPKEIFETADWKKIRIVENNEKMISLKSITCDIEKISIRPQYFLQGIVGASPQMYLRESVTQLLIKAAELLPNDHRLVLWDGWRPLKVQHALFEKHKAQLRKTHLNEDYKIISTMASRFVSAPSNNPTSPPPHNTGGSIDLSILGSNNKPLNMGTAFDDFSTKAATRHFEEEAAKHTISDDEIEPFRNRRFLCSIMLEVGFTNYAAEWWHFDYGNQFWAAASGNDTAFYGRTSPNKSNNLLGRGQDIL